MRYFAAVADELHFGRAAERLHMAQSPLSHQIRQLERRLGVVLLDRHHHVVGLTAAGEVFLADSRRILADIDRAVERARRAGRGEMGRLHVGYVAEMNPDLLASVVREHRIEKPEVSLDLIQDTSRGLLADVGRGTVDVAFVRAPDPLDGIEYEKLVEEPMRLARPAGRAGAGGRAVRLADLAGQPLVAVSAHTARGLRRDTERVCREAGVEPRVECEAGSLTAMLLLVAAGAGVALVPGSLAERYPVPGVEFAEVEDRPVTSAGICWRAGDKAPTVSRFVAIARAAARPPQRSVRPTD